ncbi:MAG: hypothetical protein HQ521_01105 [Bacteroidetes bacterium]|nr:hypothetical protein [Bacteroidota bacterium]
MDSNTIANWSITILDTAAFIFYLKMRKKKLEKKTFSTLQKFANENGCEISSYDHWDKCLIGISSNNGNKLLFIHSHNNQEFRSIIDLADVKTCRMNKIVRSVLVDKERTSIIDKISMDFTFINRKSPDVQLEIYNTDYDELTLWKELEMAQKWTGLVNGIISKNMIRESEKPFTMTIPSEKLKSANDRNHRVSRSTRGKRAFETAEY